MKINNNNNIYAQLLNISGDVNELKEVSFIKIKSKDYNLIIMKDYMPIIGEIDGSIEIGMYGKSVKLKNITGYYVHKHNEFKLFYVDNIKTESK